jgi:hypothetical protein
LNPGEFGLFDYKLQITNYKFHQVFWAATLLEKRFSYREARGARSETLVLSGAGVEDLVALETWLSDSEIVNFT